MGTPSNQAFTTLLNLVCLRRTRCSYLLYYPTPSVAICSLLPYFKALLNCIILAVGSKTRRCFRYLQAGLCEHDQFAKSSLVSRIWYKIGDCKSCYFGNKRFRSTGFWREVVRQNSSCVDTVKLCYWTEPHTACVCLSVCTEFPLLL